MQTATIDMERQKQARVYARMRRRLMLVDLVVGGVYTAAWLVFGWAVALRSALEGLTAKSLAAGDPVYPGFRRPLHAL